MTNVPTPPPRPVRLSEAQYDRLVDDEALVCLSCGGIGPTSDRCATGEPHQLITIVDAEASGIVEVDFPDGD